MCVHVCVCVCMCVCVCVLALCVAVVSNGGRKEKKKSGLLSFINKCKQQYLLYIKVPSEKKI